MKWKSFLSTCFAISHKCHLFFIIISVASHTSQRTCPSLLNGCGCQRTRHTTFQWPWNHSLIVISSSSLVCLFNIFISFYVCAILIITLDNFCFPSFHPVILNAYFYSNVSLLSSAGKICAFHNEKWSIFTFSNILLWSLFIYLF